MNMKSDKLTETERRYVEGWERFLGITSKASPKAIREMMRRTAYHEAGHIAAHMFVGSEPTHVELVTILSDGASAGFARIINYGMIYLETPLEPMKRVNGRRLLLGILAGRGAEALVTVPEKRTDILDEDSEEWEKEGTDLFDAKRVADMMARPGMSATRVLAQAEKWTIEMLALPDVRKCIEELANRLLEHGTIDDLDEIMDACAGIFNAWEKLPKWRRRLAITEKDFKLMKQILGRIAENYASRGPYDDAAEATRSRNASSSPP